MSNDKNVGDAPPNEIYVDLDCLLDTRMGCLSQISDELASAVLEKDYHLRTHDFFEGVDAQVFNDAYAQRDVETLARSVFTNVVSFLQSCIRSGMDENVKGGQNPGFSVTINTHPYDLNEKEIEMIKDAMTYKLYELAEVKMISQPYAYLTPKYLKDTFAMLVVYDIEPWLEIHNEALKTIRIPGVVFIAPALYRKIPTPEELQQLEQDNLPPPIRAVEIALAPVMGVRFLDASVFSIFSGIKGASAKAAPTPKKPTDAPVTTTGAPAKESTDDDQGWDPV